MIIGMRFSSREPNNSYYITRKTMLWYGKILFLTHMYDISAKVQYENGRTPAKHPIRVKIPLLLSLLCAHSASCRFHSTGRVMSLANAFSIVYGAPTCSTCVPYIMRKGLCFTIISSPLTWHVTARWQDTIRPPCELWWQSFEQRSVLSLIWSWVLVAWNSCTPEHFHVMTGVESNK